MSASTGYGKNRLLEGLGAADRAAIEPSLLPFKMIRGAILHPHNSPIDYVYFPVNGMISILSVMSTGEQIETAIVGREGVVGASIGSFGPNAFGQAIVQVAGEALRCRSANFLKLFESSENFRRSANAFQGRILAQAQQSAACHALHTVEARLCRWLLQSQDVVEFETFELTHEFLAHMLGVQRTAVSLNASAMQKAGLIAYSRGAITILDRAGLQRRSCECYEATRMIH